MLQNSQVDYEGKWEKSRKQLESFGHDVVCLQCAQDGTENQSLSNTSKDFFFLCALLWPSFLLFRITLHLALQMQRYRATSLQQKYHRARTITQS